MARGLLTTVTSPRRMTVASTLLASPISNLPITNYRTPIIPLGVCRRISLSSTRFVCRKCSIPAEPIDLSKYRDAFAKRMEMAGLNPRHRIVLGVSGGPDSMALCVLTAHWKTEGASPGQNSSSFIDGLLAVVVDHGLREESKEEAKVVSRRVSNMGIRCEIAHCDWPDGRPKKGHLQEAARDMRYSVLQDICLKQEIGVLLIAHHADDQAELFILRLSRSSGVLGLAGMAFTSQLFPSFPLCKGGHSENLGILLVRPLLDLSKKDLYKICIGADEEWVEDPTNQSPMFARNRIRMALNDMESSTFKPELQALISVCRKTRSYIDHVCNDIINQAVSTMAHGYVVIDLEILDPSRREDMVLSKLMAVIVQFVSQRHRPVRGGALRLLLEYVRTRPCKTSLTAAGCYLCAAPGMKGTKVLVCCSINCVLPSKMKLYSKCSDKLQYCIPCEIEKIIMEGESWAERLVPNASDIHFLDAGSPHSVLVEAKQLQMLSDATFRSIYEMQMYETKRFKSVTEGTYGWESNQTAEFVNSSLGELFRPGESCYFMNRFLITWEPIKESDASNNLVASNDLQVKCEGKRWDLKCSLCGAGSDSVASIRHMVDADWLYLAKLLEYRDCEYELHFCGGSMQSKRKKSLCSVHARLSAQKALSSLKAIPVAARRALPVLVSPDGLLLSIPSIGFTICPCLKISATFKPRVPLGGGHSSFI